MKKTLFTLALLAAAGIASAQSATPVPAPGATAGTVAPKVAADKTATEGERADLRTDRTNRKAERAQLKADRAAGNTAAVKTDLAAKKADTAAMHEDKAQVTADHTTTHDQRAASRHGKAATAR